MIGTTGSAPTIGTRTRGIRAPVPYPATPPINDVISAVAAIAASCATERPSNPKDNQPSHSELNPIIGQDAPRLDLGHVSSLGKAAKHLACFLACCFARQRERFAAKRVPGRTAGEGLGATACNVGGAADGVHARSSRAKSNAKPRRERVVLSLLVLRNCNAGAAAPRRHLSRSALSSSQPPCLQSWRASGNRLESRRRSKPPLPWQAPCRAAAL